ncbi:MAG TPA: benzoyl-CoA-dihydrodiol lyase, partial [Acidimicrobiaceae bacterium]|nr:benzoyl-CoA-dihydrodiol lyase [Acidimicrobiaceae bacterium]
GGAAGNPAGAPPAPACLRLTPVNLGAMAMSNGITRLRSRLWGDEAAVAAAEAAAGRPLDAAAAAELGLVTFALDDLDWDDELRLAVEERASFSPDALTAMEANHRFCGPETMATKILGRLSAWQNWVFSRPNASGPDGALARYGTGARPDYDTART